MRQTLLLIRTNRNIILLYAVLIILIVIGGVASPRFLTGENLTDIINQTIPLVLVSLGQTIALLIAGLDLSVGAVVSVATVLGAKIVGFSIMTSFLYLLVILSFSTLIGIINGISITKLRLHPLIATLCTGLIGNGIALLIMPTPGGYIPPSSVSFLAGGVGLFHLPMIYFLVISVGVYFLLHHTRLGRHIYAVGANPRSAEVAGIKSEWVTIKAYILSSILAGLGGIFLAFRVYSGAPTIGDPYTLDSVIVVLIGGTSFLGGIGGIGGTIAGAFLVTTIDDLLNFLHINPFYHYIVRGLLFLAAVLSYNIRWRRK